MREILSAGFDELGLPISEEMLSRFSIYYDHLTERNSVMNLTAITGIEDSARLHFLDCVALLSLYNFSRATVVDVGTGAGFPGLPLKIAQPDVSLTLLDANQKRITFLEEVCQLTELSGVHCIKTRAEDIADEIGGSFDVAVSRAVARLNVLCELCLPFVHVGGSFIAMKGPDCTEELEEAAKAISILGGAKPQVKTYKIPGTDITHSAIIIKKIKPTPFGYPRSFGKIKNSPL